jgi:hypothetical protein
VEHQTEQSSGVNLPPSALLTTKQLAQAVALGAGHCSLRLGAGEGRQVAGIAENGGAAGACGDVCGREMRVRGVSAQP